MGNWVTFKFWFGYFNEPLLNIFMHLFVVFVLLLLVLAIVSLIMRRRSKSRRLWGRLENFGWSNLVIGAVLLFFHYEQTPFFTARIILLAWVILMLYWFVKIFQKVKLSPEAKKRYEAEKLFKKYLPK